VFTTRTCPCPTIFFKKEMGRGKYDYYFDDSLGNFVTLRTVNYTDAWQHDIMSYNMILMHDMT
jgi:hypothetical protein